MNLEEKMALIDAIAALNYRARRLDELSKGDEEWLPTVKYWQHEAKILTELLERELA